MQANDVMVMTQGTSLATQPPPGAAAAPVQTWVWLVLVAAAGVACFTDLRSMKIPNWLTLPLLAAGLTHAAMTGGWYGLLLSLGASLTAGLIFIIGYAFFRGGAGDAKLMLAIGSWVDFDHAMLLMLTVTIAGFLQAMVVVVIRGSVTDIPIVIFDGWWKVLSTAKRLIRGRLPIEAAEAPGMSSAATAPEGDAGAREGRVKGWFPYAPAIMLGTVGAWWYSVKFGGFR